jgi:hypothetical protein
MADTSTFSAAMKTEFIGPIRDTIPQGRVLLYGDPEANPTDFKGIQSSAEGIDYVGNEWRIPQTAQRNQSTGFRSENETLPAPNANKYTYQTDVMRFAYGLMNITGPLMKAAESGQGAFKPALQAEMDGLTTNLKIELNRAAWGDGSGFLAGTATGSATAVTLDTTVNFRGLGEIVDFVSTAGVAVANGPFTVTAVNRTTKVITVSPSLGGALSGQLPVRASSDSTASVPNNSFAKEINGLRNIVGSTNVLHGLNPTTYSFWASYLGTSTGAINDTVLRVAKDTVGFNAGADVNSGLDYALITTRGIRRAYADTLTNLRRFDATNTVKLNGGFEVLTFDGNPVFVDDQCPTGELYGLALNKMFWAQGDDWQWMDEDGKTLKWEPRRDRYIAVLYKYCNLGTTFRTANFRLSNLTDDIR